MNLKTKRLLCLLVGIASVLTIVGTVSYAYFTTVGDMETQEATISTGTARVRFADGSIGITKELTFGESIEKTFTIENTGTVVANVKMYWKDLVNTYLSESLTYTLSQSDAAEGPYTEIYEKASVPKNEKDPSMPTSQELSEQISIPVGKTYHYKLVITLNYLSDVNQDSDMNAKFSSSFDLKDVNDIKDESIIEKIIASSNGEKTSFTSSATTDEGIFEMKDTYGTSYYYRGAVENNYVKFGTNKAGQQMWWRIIRVNGDGTLRIQYDGAGEINSNTYTRDVAFSSIWATSDSDIKYMGYMYSPSGSTASTSISQTLSNTSDSTVKTRIDAWYKENIIDTGYSNFVSDNIFCNDREISKDPSKDSNNNYNSYNFTTLGYGKNPTLYKTYSRLGYAFSTRYPVFTCTQKSDAFTVSDTSVGNGKLKYPVGLITADEVTAAGSMSWSSNNSYYLRTGKNYYTMSPWYYHLSRSGAIMYFVSASGELSFETITTSLGVLPVINLSQEYISKMVGDGTKDSPYRLK